MSTDQVKFLKGRQFLKLSAAEVPDEVVLEVENEQLREALEGLVAHADDGARVEVERGLQQLLLISAKVTKL